MRKFQQRQILDIIASMHAIHEEIRQRISKREYPVVLTMFSDCQETAIQVGEAIEQIEGDGTEAVAYLEQYCERLYQVSQQLEDISAQKIYKRLEEILIKAENAIKNIQVRIEVVFMPYKASMWDSLESVYLAAKEDEQCDAYVVPIPYYDKNPDDSLGEMHYEGDAYPEDIEITHYDDYSFEERRPDVIYIHNPYDACNVLTCVDERFFCKNLKKYTELLVYIPYFILEEIEPDDQEAIDKMKHFIFLPGIICADKVIVQSEKMRQIYINEFIKEAESFGLTGKYIDRKELEGKILGLGSPKLDKVRNTCREDLRIPEEWLEIIKKPDGAWKKIILYNVSVSLILNYGEIVIEKMKDVFRIFEEQQDEIVLLWRPHPLFRATIKKKWPQLVKEYDELLECYRNEGWGIYDDSSDVDRAIVLSDAYYGDWSSLVQMYQETGKPIMIQNIEVTSYSNSG